MERFTAVQGPVARRLLLACLLAVVAGCGGSGSHGPAAPSGLSYPSPQQYSVGMATTALMPLVTGTVSSYNVAPALPAGLVLDSTNGQISGTPTATAAAANYKITGSNSGGSTSFDLS